MTTTASSNSLLHPRLDPQRRAWGILLLAFASFCTICVVTGIGLIYFLFQSDVPLDTILRVGRGTGVVSGQAVSDEATLTNGNILRTDPQTQVTVFFRDSIEADRLIATVTLGGDTTLTTGRMTRPRFEWSTGQYGIELRGLSGKLNVFVPNDLGRDFRLTIVTKQGDLVYLDGSGQYAINASDTQVQVVNRQGVALLIPAGTNSGRSIPVNAQGTITYATSASEAAIADAPINLLPNSTFQNVFTPPNNGGGVSTAQVLDWNCTSIQDDLPRGTYQPEMDDGRSVLRLLRDNNATTHGETRCVHFFGQYGLDVTGYNYVSLRTTFKIGFQSLNVCGFDASECPMMLQIDYGDAKGVGHHWIHGFYSLLQPELNYPLQCNSCSQEHEHIYLNSWYTYDTDNLFNLFPPDSRPVSIANIQFYASGHEYDVDVGEVALLAGNNPAP